MGAAPVAGPARKDRGRRVRTTAIRQSMRFYGPHRRAADVVRLVPGGPCGVFRHGITPPPDADRKPEARFWPEQLFFMDTVFVPPPCWVVLIVREGGANLTPPRWIPPKPRLSRTPRGYFLSLFQMLKLLPGSREVIGTIIWTALMVVMLLIPLLDRVLPLKLAHSPRLRLHLVEWGGLPRSCGKLRLTRPTRCFRRKTADQARQQGSTWARLPDVGYPTGRLGLYSAAATHSRRAAMCWIDDALAAISSTARGAARRPPPDLHGFGSRTWVRGLLEQPTLPAYFGKVEVRRHGRMEEEL